MSTMTISSLTIPVRSGLGPRPSRHLRAVPVPAPVAAPLRLTRRGRLSITLVAAAILSVGAVSGAQDVVAGGAPVAVQTEAVTVAPGQSLWSIATNAVPGADPRDVIIDIQELNDLPSVQVVAGQRLVVPAG